PKIYRELQLGILLYTFVLCNARNCFVAKSYATTIINRALCSLILFTIKQNFRLAWHFTIFFVIFLSVLSSARPQRFTPFNAVDRVVFLGNSITDGGHYHSYIWLYYMTRYPQMNLLIQNAGIGGDRVIEMLKRLDGDVFSKQPTVLIATFGMNDSGYFEYNG